MRILITGATGFIGSALSDSLQRRGHTLRLGVRDVASARRRWPRADIVALDFAAESDWGAAVAGVDVVINTVGIIAGSSAFRCGARERRNRALQCRAHSRRASHPAFFRARQRCRTHEFPAHETSCRTRAARQRHRCERAATIARVRRQRKKCAIFSQALGDARAAAATRRRATHPAGSYRRRVRRRAAAGRCAEGAAHTRAGRTALHHRRGIHRGFAALARTQACARARGRAMARARGGIGRWSFGAPFDRDRWSCSITATAPMRRR